MHGPAHSVEYRELPFHLFASSLFVFRPWNFHVLAQKEGPKQEKNSSPFCFSESAPENQVRATLRPTWPLGGGAIRKGLKVIPVGTPCRVIVQTAISAM